MKIIDELVNTALAEVGYKEGANNDNKYGKWYHFNNVPWCMIFVQWCFAEAAIPRLIMRTAGCEAFEAWAHKEGLIVDIKTAKKGDIVLFDFTKSGKSEHVGIARLDYNKTTRTIPTVDGNTGNSSQANGDGVYLRNRSIMYVRAVVRPKYQEIK